MRDSGWAQLTKHLIDAGAPELRLRWDEIEQIMGHPLPASKRYPAFWSNATDRASAWRAAGYRVSRAGCAPDEVKFVAESTSFTPGPEVVASVSTADDSHADVILVGCVKEKRSEPSRAADLYVSPLFAKRRAYAEAAGLPWFILSAEYGVLRPDDWVAPYDRRLGDQPAQYLAAWGEWCAARLVALTGSLSGRTVEIHAGQEYVEPLLVPLSRAGARLVRPLEGLRMGEQLA